MDITTLYLAYALLLAALLALLLWCARPVGWHMATVMQGGSNRAVRLGTPLEHALYRMARINPAQEMTWQQYALAVLLFSGCGVVTVYALLRLQGWLPLNPQHMTALSADTAFNTAISFVTNTNWQSYSGESALSYLTQLSALAVQNFVSAATGLAVAFAVMRGFIRHQSATLGNFWVDLVRATLYVLLPLSVLLAIVLAVNGVIQNFAPYQAITTLDGQHTHQSTQWLPMGPVASQEAIKELGTNGGGFFNANSAHPFENPTPFTNVLQMLAILLIPVALTVSFGKLVSDSRQGWTVLAAMLLLLYVPMIGAMHSEQTGNPAFTALGVDQAPSNTQGGGNLEGKETRFGALSSAVFASITTGTSTGAVNSMHDSFTPLGGLMPLALIQLGEVAPGGVGSGLYGMLLFALLSVFIAGLMIGRTPEYLGKKIEAFEMKMMSLAILVTPLIVLIGTAIATATEAGSMGVGNPGVHGFSEILYAFSSAGNNNGSAFAGLSVNTPFYNIALGIAMWLGRFWIIVPMLAIAGSLASKPRLPVTSGTLPTHGVLFVVMLIAVVLLVGLLTYVPALALGPVAEQLLVMH